MAVKSTDKDDFTSDFDPVRSEELGYIGRRRQRHSGARDGDDEHVANSLVGLAFSGGGIRSATTNLGVVQALSRMGILRRVDYLSTVSGGGYIGGCLSALLSVNNSKPPRPGNDTQFEISSRHDLQFDTEWTNFPFNPERRRATSNHGGPQAIDEIGTKIVAHLRTHGDFLIARRSILKREALRAVGNLVGGVLYTLVMGLLSVAVASLVLLGAAHVLSRDVVEWKTTMVAPVRASVEVQYTRPGESTPAIAAREASDPGLRAHVWRRIELVWDAMTRDIGTRHVLGAIFVGVATTLLVAILFMVAIKKWHGPKNWLAGESREDAFEIRLLKIASALVIVTALIVPIVNAARANDRPSPSWLLQPFFVMAGAYVCAVLLYALFACFFGRATFWTRGTRSLGGSYLAITLYGTIAAVVFAVLPAASYAAFAVGLTGVLGPIVSLVVGRALMTRSLVRRAEQFEISKTLLHILLAVVVVCLVGLTMIEVGAFAIDKSFVDPLNGSLYWWVLGGATTILLFLGFVVNLNRIGLHYFYRDRILETYLRTEIADESDTHKGRLETRFDTMEMPLHLLHGCQKDTSKPGNTAPYLLVSAALNLAGSRDLTRKDRKSGYFLFSKYFVGSRQTGYRKTDKYQGGTVQLGRALTVSGAAVGTGMGYQTFFAQSFLTALFNIRLGQWISNPRTNLGDRLVFWPRYILREVLSHTTERTKLVNVSDGGHTGDNVGIYPLLERRCQVIIASDAEADPAIAFGSFTEALRHAYIDLGIDVDIDLSMIMPDPVTGLSKAHCAIGRIRYPECPDRPNWLIYMKNSMTGNEPAPVLNYKRTSPDFPHESTADQFFDDTQFESYRALGDHIAEETFARWVMDPAIRSALNLPMTMTADGQMAKPVRTISRVLAWDDLRIRHSPFRAANNEQFQSLTKQISDLERLFLETPTLRWYYEACMGLSPKPEKRPADQPIPVNVIAMQIQMMEDAYFSLRLDQYANARDNRGWMNLFRQWGNSTTFKEIFHRLKQNYSSDFVAFYCDYIEEWEPIDTHPVPHAWDVQRQFDPKIARKIDREYEHPSAKKCAERNAAGLFQDAGRLEAREPDSERSQGIPPEHPTAGQHGDTGLTTESMPMPQTPPPPDTGKQ